MGRYILKCNPDEDLYVIWSSIVDNWVYIGDREEIKAELIADWGRHADLGALDAADVDGTSSRYHGDGWDDDRIIVHNLKTPQWRSVCRWLPRAALTAYVKALLDDDTGLAESFTVPVEPDYYG